MADDPKPSRARRRPAADTPAEDTSATVDAGDSGDSAAYLDARPVMAAAAASGSDAPPAAAEPVADLPADPSLNDPAPAPGTPGPEVWIERNPRGNSFDVRFRWPHSGRRRVAFAGAINEDRAVHHLAAWKADLESKGYVVTVLAAAPDA